MAWFPITDLAREDDIRLRRRRALLLVSCIVFVPWLLFGQTHHRVHFVAPDRDIHIHVRAPKVAATRLPDPDSNALRSTITAGTLRIDLPCAESVALLSDDSQPGKATISVRRGEHDAIEALHLSAGSISQTPTCEGAHGNFIVRVAPSTPLTLVQSGVGDIRGGSFTSPVSIESGGSGDVTLNSSGPLKTRQIASGDVLVRTVTGPVTAMLEGSGDLKIDYGSIETLTATSEGSGDLQFGQAVIGGGATSVILHGSGDFAADAITGPVDARTMSSGDISIGSLIAAHARLDGFGSGDILVGRGRIDSLSSHRTGSGDLTIHAAVDGGQILHHGSGDLTLPDDSKATVQDER